MSKAALKETLVLMAKLCIICVIVAGLLAFVNIVTAPIIEKNEQKVFEESMAEVLPGAASFEEVKEFSFTTDESGVVLESFYKADNGFVVSTICSEGYGGDIKVMVGINNDLTVNQIKIMSMSETAGLGAKASEESFLSQYSGLKSGIGVEKNNGGNPDKNTISAISGATVTSKAVTKAVNLALAVAEGGGASE